MIYGLVGIFGSVALDMQKVSEEVAEAMEEVVLDETIERKKAIDKKVRALKADVNSLKLMSESTSKLVSFILGNFGSEELNNDEFKNEGSIGLEDLID